MPAASKKDWALDLILICIFVILCNYLWLGHYPLFTPDEGRYSEIAREMLVSKDFVTPRMNGIVFLDKPILYYWLQATAIYFFGIKEWALRFFPALFGVFSCLITYVTGRILFTRRAAIYGALILATTPLYFIGAHYANLDLEIATLITASVFSFMLGFHFLNQNRNVYFYLGYFFAALAFLTKGLIGFVFPGLIISSWLLLTKQWRLLSRMCIPAGACLVLAICAPWFILAQQANPEFLQYFFVTQQFSRFLSQGDFNNQNVFWFYVPVIILGFFPWSCFLLQSIFQYFKASVKNPYELFLILWGAIVLLFFSIPHAKLITYILPFFPAAALLVGHYLSTRNADHVKLGIYLVILCLTTSSGLLYYLTYIKQNLAAPGFHIYLIMMSIVTGFSALLILLQRKSLKAVFRASILNNLLLLLILVHGAPYLNTHSAKKLSLQLKPQLNVNDQVINYHTLHQDVLLYLDREIMVVSNWQDPTISRRDNWKRELWLGMNLQKSAPNLIDDAVFWRMWQSKQRVFVFLEKKHLDDFGLNKPITILGMEGDIVLISNR